MKASRKDKHIRGDDMTICLCGLTKKGYCKVCDSHAPPTRAERREFDAAVREQTVKEAANIHSRAVNNMVADTIEILGERKTKAAYKHDGRLG